MAPVMMTMPIKQREKVNRCLNSTILDTDGNDNYNHNRKEAAMVKVGLSNCLTMRAEE